VVVGSVNFILRRIMKSEYIDQTLPDNTTGWKQGWFYLDNPAPALRKRTGWIPSLGPEWTNQLATRDTEELKPLLDDRGGHQLLPPPHPASPGPTHPAFEYWGQSHPTRVTQCKVSKAEMMARAKNIFGRRIRNKECPKALEVYSPSDPVSFRPFVVLLI
jgi:hypothetical protein